MGCVSINTAYIYSLAASGVSNPAIASNDLLWKVEENEKGSGV